MDVLHYHQLYHEKAFVLCELCAEIMAFAAMSAEMSRRLDTAQSSDSLLAGERHTGEMTPIEKPEPLGQSQSDLHQNSGGHVSANSKRLTSG